MTVLWREVAARALAGPRRPLPLAARETRRFARSPVFPAGAGLTAYALWSGQRGHGHRDRRRGHDRGGLPRRVRDDGRVLADPAGAVQRTGRRRDPGHPARTAALCAVAVVPFGCGIVTLLAFLRFHPAGDPACGAFSSPARVAVLAGQIVIAPLGGPLPGVAPGRWARFPGAAFVLFLVLSGWVNLVTALTIARPDSAPAAVLRLFSPFALFTLHSDAGVTAWRGSPWFFAAGSSPCARSRSWQRCCAAPGAGPAPGSSAPRASRA